MDLGTRNHNSAFSSLNMTPFVDVCLVLLIIFMVTAPFAMPGVDIQLPKATKDSIKQSSSPPAIVSVSEKGVIFFNNHTIPLSQLAKKAAEWKKTNPQSAVFVRADARLSYEKVLILMAQLKQAGIEKISLLSDDQFQTKPLSEL